MEFAGLALRRTRRVPHLKSPVILLLHGEALLPLPGGRAVAGRIFSKQKDFANITPAKSKDTLFSGILKAPVPI